MPYFFERFEYKCTQGHRNPFDFTYFASETADVLFDESELMRLPDKLPCSGCKYKLVPASLVRLAHGISSEVDFYKFREDKYVESAAYHEAGHITIAAAQQIPLKERGIRIDQKGSGVSNYKVAKPNGTANAGPDAKREKTIQSTQAGYIAQAKYYLRFFDRLPESGSSSDTDGINGLVEEMYSDRNACEDAKAKLFKEAEQLVEQHWQAIEALAQTLLKKEWTSQAPPSGERRWSTQLREKKMDGSEIAAFLQQFQILAFVEC